MIILTRFDNFIITLIFAQEHRDMTTSFLYDRTSSENAIAITHNQVIVFHSWVALLNSANEIGDRTVSCFNSTKNRCA